MQQQASPDVLGQFVTQERGWRTLQAFQWYVHIALWLGPAALNVICPSHSKIRIKLFTTGTAVMHVDTAQKTWITRQFSGFHSHKAEPQIITHADDSHGSNAFSTICVWFRLSVCMIKPKRLKLKSPNLAQRQSITSTRPSINIRSKGQGHKLQKLIEGDQVDDMSLHPYWVAIL